MIILQGLQDFEFGLLAEVKVKADKEIAEIVNANAQDVEDALFRLIQKGQAAGQFSDNNSARSLARFVFNTISGLRIASKSGADKKVFDDIVRVTLSALK